MPASLTQPVVNVAVVVLRRPGKVFRRFRRSVRAIATLLALAPIVVIVLTQGPVPRYLLKRAVQGQLGGPIAGQAAGAAGPVEFDSRWVSVKLDGRVVIEQPRLTNTAIAGSAGELFIAESITLNAEWSAITAGLSGVMSAADVRIERPVFRISVDRQDGTLNLAGVGAATPSASTKTTDTTLRVPRIEIERGRLVLMEHGPTPENSAAEPAELVDLQTRGWLTSLPAADQYLLRLRAEDPFGGNTPIDLTGTVDLARGQGVIDAGSLQLARWGPTRMPAIVRDTWERLRLRGTIQQTRLRFGPEIGVQTELRLQDVALNVPVAAGRAEITGSRTPRMDGVTGTLRLTTGSADGSNAGLEADLAGSFEDLPAHVRLVTRGLSLTSPYSATISAEQFRLERDPRILWFTPEIVQKNFERFSGPTALVDARIEVSRGRPESETVAGETIIRGSLMFREGAAAFDQFPYPIHNLAGTITFNEDEVRIIGLRGDGPTGGKFLAEGVIAPPTADAKLNIDVVVTDVPLDDALADAIRRSKGRELADAIFSRPDYDRLLGAGMVLSSAAKRQYEQEIAQIEATLASSDTPDAALISRRSDLQRRLAAPLADFGGLLDSIAVKVRSDFGFAAPTRQEIRVRFRDAMLLTKFFPLPMRAQRLELLVTDDAAIMEGVGLMPAGTIAGESADPGSMDLLARVDIRRDPATGQWTYDPNVAARVRQVRVTPLLIAAIPDKQAAIAGPVPPGERSPGVQALLSQLNIQGSADADVLLTTPPGGETSLSVDLRFENVASSPRFTQLRRAEPGTLHDVAGRIRINDDAIVIDSLRGLVSHQQPKTEGDAGPAVPGVLELRGHWMLDETSAAATRTGLGRGGLSVSIDRLDTSLSLEDLVRPIAPAVSSVIERQREAFGPTGRVDVALRVDQALQGAADAAGDPLRVDATIRNARNLSLLATTRAGVAPQRVNMLQDRGEIRILAAADDATPVTLAFTDLSAVTSIDGQPLGRIEIDGALAIDTNSQTDDQADATSVAEPLTIRLRDARFESVVVADLLRRYAPPAVNERYAAMRPVGQFDAELTAAPTLRQADGARTGTLLQAALRPVDLAFSVGDTRYTLPNVSGQITLDNLTELVSTESSTSSLPRGELQELTVVSDDWFGSIHGPWAITPGAGGQGDGGWTLKAMASLEASRSSSATSTSGLPDDLLAMLPPSVPAALQDYAIAMQSLAVRDVQLELTQRDRSIALKASGAASVRRLDLSRAVNVQNLSGVVTFDASGERADDGFVRAEVNLALNATRARIEGLLLSGLSAGATLHAGDPARPTLVLHTASGALYGGRVSLSGALLPTAGQAGTNRPAEVQIAMAGVRLADVMTELSRRGRAVSGPPVPDSLELPLPSAEIDDDVIASDASRGVIDLDLALRASISDDPLQSLDGRGALRIAQGSAIFDLPVVVGLIGLSNLRLPSDDKFDYAAADFTLAGPRIGVQRIVMLSDTLALIGAGNIDLPDGRLDLAVNSRSRHRLPIISAIIETIRDELLTASITGTITEPSYSVSTLSGTRRAIARLFGSRDSGPSIPATELDRYERDRHNASTLLSPHRQAAADTRLMFDATAALHGKRTP